MHNININHEKHLYGLNLRRSSSFGYILRVRFVALLSCASVILLIAATLIPIYNIADTAKATIGTPTISTLTFVGVNPVASVSLSVGSPTGTFATSSSSEKAAFSISTNNYTGYTLTMTSTGSNTTLADGSSHNISAIPNTTTEAVFSADSAAGQALNNRWGYIPNYYNSTANTTNYYPAPTSVNAATLRTTSVANSIDGTSNADDYTIGLGFRADYNSPSGTYANDSFIMNFVANPISYKITFNDNSGDSTVSGLPGVINSAASEASITLPSTEPTRTGYTFRAWCLGEASSYANVCTGTEFEKGSSFGLDQTANNTNIQLYAVWTGNEYTATIYYNDKTSAGTLGTTNIASTTKSCRVTDNSNSCSPEVPSAVTASVGTYNNAYKGLATTTGTMTTSSTITLNGASADRYAVYGGNTGGTSKVTIYKPSSTSAATSVTLYRNQRFTSKTAMSSTVLSNSETGTSNWTYAFAVTSPTYTLFGFNTATNSTSRVSTCGAAGTTACSSIANLAMSNITTAYAVERVSVSATFYYNNNTTTTSCTTANVTSTTNSAWKYLYTTSTTAATVKDANIGIPSVVSSSKGTCGMTYRNVGTSVSGMTAATPSTSTIDGVYYARYSGSITNNYYTGSAYTSRTIYRNQRVSGTATNNMSDIVLSTSGTGTGNYSTATGPGSSVWTGLATSSTTTPAYTTVAAAATANAVYTTLYTIYQFNVSYSTTGSTGVSSIGTSTGSGISYCRVNATSTTAGGTSCTVTTPSITAETGYTSLGWGTQGHTAAGTAASSSYTLTSTGGTLYANAKINQYTCTKRYRLQNADGTWGSYTADGTSQVNYGATCSYSKTVTDYKNTASGTNNAQASTSCTITTSGCTASLSFYRNTFGLTVNRNTTYISSASATTTAVHTTSNVPYYRWGQAVAITATASTGNEFTSWTQSGTAGTFADATSASTTFTMGKGAATVTAGGKASCTHTTFSGNMQNYSTSIVAAACIGDTGTLKDTRDNEQYIVAKLADGKLWMLDNLRLGSTSTTNLTTSNTNIASNWTLPAGITSGFGSLTAAQINVASKNTVSSETYGNGSGKIGVYYNYCAASAGTYCSSSGSGNAQYDICPKGWRMPTSGANGEDFENLDGAYNSNIDTLNALSTPLSGRFYNKSVRDEGEYGYFWTSIYDNTDSMVQAIATYVPTFIPSDAWFRDYGESVRCILK